MQPCLFSEGIIDAHFHEQISIQSAEIDEIFQSDVMFLNDLLPNFNYLEDGETDIFEKTFNNQ